VAAFLALDGQPRLMLGILSRLGLTLGCTRGVLRPALDAAGLGLTRLE
jgi:hypothetical protein